MRLSFSYIITLSVVTFGTVGILLTQSSLLSSINAWIVLLVISLIVGLVASILSNKRVNSKKAVARVSSSGRLGDDKLFFNWHGRWSNLAKFLPLILLVPGYLALFLSTRMQLAAHGYLHSAYVYQIINGNTPPENVLFPGYPANIYWPYHALVATLSQLFSFPPPLMATILSAVTLVVAIGLLYEIVEILLINEKRPLILTVLAFFSLFGANLFGTIHSIAGISPNNKTLQATIVDLFPKALFGDERLTIPLVKYLGFDATPVGWLIYIFVLLVIIKGLSGRIRDWEIVIACLATFAALALHATEGIFIVLAVPPALVATYLLVAFLEGELLKYTYHMQKAAGLISYFSQRWQWSIIVVVLLGTIGLATLRFLLSAAVSRGASTTFSVDFVSLVSLKSIFSMIYPLIPFFLLAGYYAYRSKDKRMIFFVSLTVIGIAIGYAFRMSNNEYKFVFCATIAMSILCTVPIWFYVFDPTMQHHPLGKVVGLIMLSLMFVNILAAGLSHLAQPWVEADNFVVDGVHVNSRTAYNGTPYPEVDLSWARDENGDPYPSDLQWADVFQWVRENTPTDAILVVPMNHRDQSSLLVLSERVPYVVNGVMMTNELPDYEQRVRQISQIYDSDAPVSYALEALDAIRGDLDGREKYLLYPISNTELGADPTKHGLELVFSGRTANLFRIIPP